MEEKDHVKGPTLFAVSMEALVWTLWNAGNKKPFLKPQLKYKHTEFKMQINTNKKKTVAN